MIIYTLSSLLIYSRILNTLSLLVWHLARIFSQWHIFGQISTVEQRGNATGKLVKVVVLNGCTVQYRKCVLREGRLPLT